MLQEQKSCVFYPPHASSILIREKGSEHCNKSGMKIINWCQAEERPLAWI